MRTRQSSGGGLTGTRLVVALVCAAMTTFAQLYSPQGVLPQVAHDLDTTADTAALTISAATLGLAVAVIPWSFIGDRYGRRHAMLASVVGATVFGLVSAWLPSLWLVLLARLLQGVFLAGVPALAMAYLNEEVESGVAVVAAGWFVGGTTIGGLTGRIVATSVAQVSTWRVGLTVVSTIAALAALAFALLAPVERRFVPTVRAGWRHAAGKMATNLRDGPLVGLYLIAFLLMGGFVAVYNYLSFRLVAPPYLLPGWLVGLAFLAYLAGTVSAPRAGVMASRRGRSRVMGAMVLVMLLGLVMTLAGPLWLILVGLVVFTAGFFGAHSVASGWAGARAVEARSQSTALYNLAYYGGSSVLGWAGGLAWEGAGWTGVVGFVGASVLLALLAQQALVRRSG